jgi:DNA-binding NtrC family response regulator
MTKPLTMQEAIRNATKLSGKPPVAPPVLVTGEVNIAKPTPKREVAPPAPKPKVEVVPAVEAAPTVPQLTLAELEKLYILDTLTKAGGNKTKAADILGVSLKTIYNKLASYVVPATDESVAKEST